jgi:uracil-DNA glycosylase
MQRKGQDRVPSKSVQRMPATDDEIREKYLERAIRELNRLTHDLQECPYCPRGSLMPVLGSGHPQADIFLLKHSPTTSEVEEGVAFYGRSGSALMKSFRRLGIDPLAVYGTLCVKCPIADLDQAAEECIGRLVEEIAVVQPRIVVVMGERALAIVNRLELPLASPLEAGLGEIQRLTPTIDALYVPDIDASLDEQTAKQAFWRALRPLGEWYADQPPY